MKKVALVFASVLISVSAFAVDCSIQSWSEGFDVYQGEQFVKHFDTAKGAIGLRNQLISGKACSMKSPTEECKISAWSEGFDVYQGEQFVKRFENEQDAAVLKNQLTKAKVCN